MHTQTKTKANRVADATKRCVTSAGEIFSDGTMIESISSSTAGERPDLLLWNGKKATAGSSVEHHGLVYQAPELKSSVYRALRLPSGISEYGSARGLLTGITDVFQRYLDLPGEEAGLLSCFAMSTWMADCLPTAPSLAISGPLEELGIASLRLLSCVCRHSLMLAEITRGGLRSLPMQLGPTLLINQPDLKPALQLLFRASSHRGQHLFGNGGEFVDLYGPKAISCRNDADVDNLGDGVIHISAAPSRLQLSRLDEQVLNELAESFQPRLLMYRLKNTGKERTPQVDVSAFTLASQQLARSVALCFPDDSELANEAVKLLLPQDDEIRGRRFRDVSRAIVEILCAIARQGKQREVQVDELAKDVNTLLRSRGETLWYSPEQIGWKLKSLSIGRHSTSSGRQILLDRDTNETLQRLAQLYDLAHAQNDPAPYP